MLYNVYNIITIVIILIIINNNYRSPLVDTILYIRENCTPLPLHPLSLYIVFYYSSHLSKFDYL